MSKNKILQLNKEACYFARNFDSCEYRALPLFDEKSFIVIDFNNNGLDINLSISGIIRKFFGNNTYKLKAWFGENEGVLVVKREQVGELLSQMDFSEDSQFRYGSAPSSVLKALDFNKDKTLDPDDPGFHYLYVWHDKNQNMICEHSEVSRLSELNIVSIELSNSNSAHCYQESCHNDYDEKLTCNTKEDTVDVLGVTLLEYMS